VASSTKKKKDADAPAEEPASSLIPGLEEPASAATKSYTVLARRYRSRTFDEVVGQESISRTLQNAISTGRTAHAYLFCGTRGVGKTSMARIFARALNAHGQVQAREIGDAIMRGEDIDVVEIDGASNRGIDDARDLIAGAGIAPARSAYKIYIIDEVHMLTTPAFNALLKTMEEPPAHVKFILCTTEAHKVPATIQSRCQRFDFRNIAATKIAGHLKDVLAKESIAADDAAVMQVARLANGSMRDGLSLLDRLVAASGDSRITQAGVLVLKAQQHRTQEANRAAAMARLQAIVDAVALPPKPRRATRPTRASKLRRLEGKSQRGEIKSLRGRVKD